MKRFKSSMLVGLLVALLALALSVSQAVIADVVAGEMAVTGEGLSAGVQVVDITGTIIALEPTTRMISIDMGEGQVMSFVAGPDVENFDQLEVGDWVELAFVRALAIEWAPTSGDELWRIDEDVAMRALPGELPGAVMGHRVTALVEVMEVDASTQSVIVRGPLQTVKIFVTEAAQLDAIAAGDTLVVTYVEAMAVAVTHPDTDQFTD
jgi:hypothetical protein